MEILTMEILVSIPGPPRPQGRPRTVLTQAGVRVYDPESSRSWKGAAQVHMKEAMAGAAPFYGPLAVSIVVIFPCPAGDHKKRSPTPIRWHTKANGDLDNLAKAVMDAGNGILWLDDRQVARLEVAKFIAAQGGAPSTEIRVNALKASA